MSKSTNFSGQPIFNQLLSFIDKAEVNKIARQNNAERYVKKFNTYNHVVVMLFVTLENYYSLREVVVGLLANAHKLVHLGLSYVVRRSTFSDANARRHSVVFEDVYKSVYRQHHRALADSQLSDKDLRRLYIMDSSTIGLFKDILKGVGRNPLTGKKKGGIKVHTIMKADENVPYLIRYSAAIKHDHNFLNEVYKIPKGSIITFDRGYVDYAKYEEFTQAGIWYVTRLKDTAVYEAKREYNIPNNADTRILKDERIILKFGKKKELQHYARRIVFYDKENDRVFEFLTNNFKLSAEKICLIYKRRWQIELLFKQLKQNFPLKYFLGDNENAIEIQIWAAMLANFLITLVRSKVKKKWAFSNMVSFIRNQLMSYINVYSFLENPEGCWKTVVNERKSKYQDSLFPETKGAYF
jgi:Transposase DDE domain/Domain of unknown function (DUF4372)